MRTLTAGITRFKATPLALVPITAEGVTAGLLIALGVIPASGSSAIAGAAFPLDVFFDLKQALAQAPSWVAFTLAILVSVGVRSAVLAATVVAADGQARDFLVIWGRSLRLVAAAVVAFGPSALLMFSGTASRYAPFLWAGALLGLIPAIWLTRRGVGLTPEPASSRSAIPEASSFLSYAYLSALIGAAMSSFGDEGRLASAAIVVFAAPIHALVFLGWRDRAQASRFAGGGAIAITVTAIAIAILMAGTVYDRYIMDFPPVGRASSKGTLLLLGGVDSTARTGALAELDVRRFGFSEERARVVSYRGLGQPFTKADTHRDLSQVAQAVAEQVADAEGPVALLGHSQAGLILDRVIDRGLSAPKTSVIFAPPPPFPPSLEIPAPGANGVGKPGGDLARAFAVGLDRMGLESYDVDSAAFPTRLKPVVLIESQVPRLSVWALGDSVWLDRDWRRPGEINLVALTDHVGVVNNGSTVAAAKDFFEGGRPEGDEASWRGAFVSLLRHAFAPWRPEA